MKQRWDSFSDIEKGSPPGLQWVRAPCKCCKFRQVLSVRMFQCVCACFRVCVCVCVCVCVFVCLLVCLQSYEMSRRVVFLNVEVSGN